MRIVIVLLALLVGTQTAQADRADRIKKRIRTMRAIVLVEELALDEKTATKLMPILAKYDDEFAQLAKESLELRKQAEDLAAAGDDKAVDAVVDKLVANQRARWNLDEKRFAEVRKVLSASQAARILVVLPEIDRKILDGARRAIRGQKAKKAKKARQRRKAIEAETR